MLLDALKLGVQKFSLSIESPDFLKEATALINIEHSIVVEIGVIEDSLPRLEPLLCVHLTDRFPDQIELLLIA